MERNADIEGRIREIGLELYNSMNEAPPIFDRRRWTGRTMEWAMKDEDFKLDLFRYIDVLPSLKNDRLAVRLLDEYFSGHANLPLMIRQAVKMASKSILPYAAAAFIRAAVKSLAGESVCFDMEHYYCKDLTIEIFKRVFGEMDDHFGGIALQAYLRDTKEDLRGMIEWARERGRPVSIRLVKGSYWDYEVVANRRKGWPVPVFTNKEETDRSFEDLTVMLLENAGSVRPAIATHNIRSISNAIACAERLGLPKGRSFPLIRPTPGTLSAGSPEQEHQKLKGR